MKKSKKLLCAVLTLALVFSTPCSFPVETVAAETDIAAVGSMGYTISYSIKEDGSAQVTSIDCLYSTDVVIPADHNGHPVTSIGPDLIKYSSSPITSVEIPDTVTRIENQAFQNCGSLKSIDIPGSVTYIGEYAFGNCSKLETISLSDNITHIGLFAFEGTAWYSGQPDGNVYIGNYLYDYKSDYVPSQLTIREGTIGIADYALSNNRYEGSLVIPDSVKWIGSHAFSGSYKLYKVTIPNSVTSIGDGAFAGCYFLEDLILEEGNLVYDSRDHCRAIIETKTNTLLSATINTIIPSSVTAIANSAFCGLGIAGRLDIPDSVTEIGDYAFSGMHDLSYITIPDSVRRVGKGILNDTKWYNNQPEGVVYIGNIACGYPFGSNNKTISIKPGTTIISDGLFEDAFLLESVTIPDSVKVIGNNAFKNCWELTTVSGAGSVTEIGDSAFDGCRQLVSFSMPSTVKSIGARAFYSCSSMNDLLLPNTLVEIGSYAFYNCSHLTNAILSDSITRINDGVFEGCSSLANVQIPSHVTVIGENAFAGCGLITEFTIPQSVRFIGNGAFRGCGITSFTFPKYISEVGDYTFSSCRLLRSVTFSGSVSSIGDQAFYDCAFSAITLPDTVVYIGESAFFDCSELEEITIPRSVIRIGKTPFLDCHSLERITVDSRNRVYDSRDNCNAIIETDSNTLVNGCKNSTVPNTVRKIGKEAFRYCDRLHLSLPESVVEIEEFAFSNCYLTGGIELSDNIETIGRFAFSSSFFSSIRIPSKVTELKDSVFADCTIMTSIIIPTSVQVVKKSAFKQCRGLCDVFYAGSREEWESIRIESNNSFLLNAAIHYNYSIVEKIDEATGIVVRGYIADDDMRVDIISNKSILERFNEPSCELLNAFDIELYRNNEVLIPSLEVTVKIPSLNPKTEVYGFDDFHKDYYYVSTTYRDGYLVFTTRDLGIYATVRDASEEIIGDPDGDDCVTIMDATVIQRYLAELSVKTYVPGSADADGDGDLTIMDATAIQRYVADLPTNPDIGYRRV